MKILIIGSKGFIGAHCLKYFQKENEVWGCDVFTDYSEKHFFLISGLNSDFGSIFSETKFDVCINCSGAASVSNSILRPSHDYELNVFNVARILEAIRQYNATCKFINISSAAVYGDPKILPISESSPIKPLSPYGFHKAMAEKLCEEYYTFYQVSTCSLRIFSAFGPGLKKQLLWDVYIKSMSQSLIKLFGTGDESRDYIFVDDIIAAMEMVIRKSPFNAAIYNLGRGESWSCRKISNLLLDELNWKGILTFSGDRRTGDPDFWQADITEIRKLGFEPAMSIENGIRQYVSWLSSLD